MVAKQSELRAAPYVVRAMQSAAASGRSLTGSIDCNAQRRAIRREAMSPVRAKVSFLTDAACFSSCITAVDIPRRMGAIQIGQATNEDTHYSEVREVVLPSGLATFSTLQAIMPVAPKRIGTWIPALEFSGNISNTDSLERWVATMAPTEKTATY